MKNLYILKCSEYQGYNTHTFFAATSKEEVKRLTKELYEQMVVAFRMFVKDPDKLYEMDIESQLLSLGFDLHSIVPMSWKSFKKHNKPFKLKVDALLLNVKEMNGD